MTKTVTWEQLERLKLYKSSQYTVSPYEAGRKQGYMQALTDAQRVATED